MAELLLAEGEGEWIEPGDGAPLAVPSGQEMSLLDVIWNVPGPEGLVTRFRFLAPAIARDGGGVAFDQAQTDMAHLCQEFALPRVSGAATKPTQIIISLSDRPVPFGQSDPDATQFFEAFRIEDNACIWEVF